MLELQPLLTAQRALATARKAGVQIPKPIIDAEQRATRIANYSTNLASPELIDALVTAIDAGKDITTDKNVAAALQAQQLVNEGIRERMRNQAGQILTDALTIRDEELFDALTTVFDKAADQLATAHTTLGDVDINNADAVLRLGGHAAEAWAVAKSGVATIDTINKTWAAWAQVTKLAPIDAHWQTLRIADVDWHTWHTNKLAGNPNPWKLTQLGITLSLADANEYRQRHEALQTERAKEAEDNAPERVYR